MKRIGVVYGMEDTFPVALVERINSRSPTAVTAEHVRIGDIRMDEPSRYAVIVDRISHDIPFYRAWLKNAVLSGTKVINNPFWWSADDKFFNYALAAQLGVAVPRTVLLPHKEHPPGTTERSMRNLDVSAGLGRTYSATSVFRPFSSRTAAAGGRTSIKWTLPKNSSRAYDETGRSLHDPAGRRLKFRASTSVATWSVARRFT